jgi:uncharacterized membrane protein YeaQ/YmgE (transglycosylase-associated protein family)
VYGDPETSTQAGANFRRRSLGADLEANEFGEAAMGVLAWIVVGFFAGLLAKGVTGVRGAGCVTTVLIGVAGGLLGGMLFRAAGERGLTGFSWRSLLVATVGSVVLLLAYGLVTGRRRGRSPRRY